MKKIEWFVAEKKDRTIILYGEVENKRVFKITYKNDKYTAWMKVDSKYEIIENCDSLKDVQKACVKIN